MVHIACPFTDLPVMVFAFGFHPHDGALLVTKQPERRNTGNKAIQYLIFFTQGFPLL